MNNIVVWQGLKFKKNIKTCSRFREVFQSINVRLKKGDIIKCFRNISMALVIGKETDHTDIVKRAANVGLILDNVQNGYLTRMNGAFGKSKEVEGLHFVFSSGDEKDVGVFLRYKDHLDFVARLAVA